jgi:hypothetical protein
LVPRFGIDPVVIALFPSFCIGDLVSPKKKLSDATSMLLIPLGRDRKSGYVVIIDFIMHPLSVTEHWTHGSQKSSIESVAGT